MISGRLIRVAFFLAFAVALFVMASAFLLAAVGFGIERGDIADERPESRQLSSDLNRGGNIAFGLFLAADLGATLLVLKSGVLAPVPIHRGIKLLSLFAGFAVYSYGLVLLSLYGQVPNVLLSLAQDAGNLIMR